MCIRDSHGMPEGLVRAWNGGGRLGPEDPVRPGLRISQPQLQGGQQRDMICVYVRPEARAHIQHQVLPTQGDQAVVQVRVACRLEHRLSPWEDRDA
eukprot:15430837-Alexandrium_andersonii.AAC.1